MSTTTGSWSPAAPASSARTSSSTGSPPTSPPASSISTSSPTPATPPTSPRSPANPDYILIHGDICDAHLVARSPRHLPPQRHRPLRRRAPRRPHHPRPRSLPPHQHRRHLQPPPRRPHLRRRRTPPRHFRFLHVSTDEVYGTLTPEAPAFHEQTPFAPNSPYAASKASSDHLVRAWHHTYGLPTLITNCSNNYGPFQFPEKLIPLIIPNALAGKPLPVYGDGQQVRDWLYVADHCAAIRAVLASGRLGETYNIGGDNQRSNLAVVQTICALLDELRPDRRSPTADLIRFVQDRPGHDRRYAIDARKIESELDWHAAETFETGLRKTVEWYLDNPAWIESVTSGAYQQWLANNYSRTAREAGAQ